jgi:hypothetical protein
MNMQTDNFSPQQSLQIIQAMIEKAKDSVADKSFYFLLWGWLVFAASLIQFVLKVIVKSDLHPYAWTLMIVGSVTSAFYSRKERIGRPVKSYVDDSIRFLWTAIGITQGAIVFVFAWHGDWQNCYTFFILLYCVGCYFTGRVLRFRPLVWGAIANWMLAILSVFTTYDYNMLIMALAILVSYIIPGYLLRREHQRK